jgi:phosphoglycerol transferase MdoB-like AlkP superfamily enzyme
MLTKLAIFAAFSQFSQYFWQLLAFTGPYAPLIAIFAFGIPLLSLFRMGLMLWQAERVMATGLTNQIFLQGIRVDCILLAQIIMIPLIISPFFLAFNAWEAWRYFTFIWLVIGMTLIIFLEAATPGFIGEYDTRPNRLFVEYLKYPQEVLPMLWNGFRVHVFAGLIATAFTVWLMATLSKPWLSQSNQLPALTYWLLLPVTILLTALIIRSTIGHRPANPALFAITNDTMVNTLVLNSAYSVFYAIYNLKHESRSSKIYGKMSTEDMLAEFKTTRQILLDQRPLLNHADFPTLTFQKPSVAREKPLNIVIILEESLGATFVESLGGVPVTPELEKLKTEGWWFEHLYATGTRSVRGIEAVVAGFAPTPAQSVVKLSLAQKNFFTLASILSEKGYLTEFIYGGESHFDNMRGFFMGNGFQQVVDQKDFVNPVFTGSWGVSDEDLLNRTHEQLLQHHAEGKPFFTLAFTSSNHAPFEFPDGRIALYDAEKATENNAVKYTDYALGEFFKKAKASDYYQDTLFLIVADHDIRVRGDDLVPVKHFHIPALILGADIQPKKLTTVASQIDLPTTLLSLAGIEAAHPMIGRDISSEPEHLAGRAMMQYEQNYAWMEGQAMVVLRPDKAATFGHYNRQSKKVEIVASPLDGTATEKRALAHVMLPAWLYREERYKTKP